MGIPDLRGGPGQADLRGTLGLVDHQLDSHFHPIDQICVLFRLERELDAEVRRQNLGFLSVRSTTRPKPIAPGKVMTIKGVGYLAELMRTKTAEAQARVNSATERASGAFVEFNRSVDQVDDVVSTVEKETEQVRQLASDLTAQLTNGGPA